MKKSIFLIVVAAIFSTAFATAANTYPEKPDATDNTAITLNDNENSSDNYSTSSPLTYNIHKKQYVGWVVDFHNSSSRSIKVHYSFYNGQKWIPNTVRVEAGKWNRDNNAGVNGNIQNLSWEY